MVDLPSSALFQELRARGLIASEAAPQPLPPGNRDRRPELTRGAWRVRLGDGRDAKLTLGSGLDALVRRSAAFAQACPGIAAAPLFHERLSHGEVFAELFFDGIALDAAVRDGLPPTAIVRAAFARACEALAATQQASTEQARTAEWRIWADEVCALPVWTDSERDLLHRAVLPSLRKPLTVESPVTRWTNGDFLSGNLLVAGDGRVCLLDTEFAARTHFFVEDAVRFHVLSDAARRQPELFSATLPDPGPAWHLFFWLRQLQLEVAQNTADYLARTLPVRRAIIRRLAEQLFSQSLSGWSVAATEISYHLEQAHWVTAKDFPLLITGWCHVPSAHALRSVVLWDGGRRVAEATPSPRPDVQSHFGGNVHALNSGFVLRAPPVENDACLVLAAVTDDGTLLPFHTVRAGALPRRGPVIVNYPGWAARNDPDEVDRPRPNVEGLAENLRPSAKLQGVPPAFSVLLPVFNTPEPLLRECIESVCRQQHPHWELCIVDDASTSPHVRLLLKAFAAQDTRIRVHFRTENGGISRATNDALTRAGNEFVVLLDHDDRLRPHALAELSRWIKAEPDAGVLYSDEEKISIDGQRVEPYLKPDYSPEFLRGVMYPGHVLCARTKAARAAGGFDPAYDGIQDYEFFLRLSEYTRQIIHVPRMLYQWRLASTSSALRGNIKGDMDQRQADAVRAHLARTGQSRRVLPLGGHRVLLSADPSLPAPSVSAIIVCDGGPLPDVGMLKQRLDPGGARINEVLTDNYHGPSTAERLRRLASSATGDVLVFLTFMPLAFPAGWLAELATLAALDDTGAVAPIMLTPDGRVFDAGWIVGLRTVAPMMRGFDANDDGYGGSLRCNRETSAVSGLCFAVRLDRYEKVGGIRTGFDAPLWAIDLCLRLEAEGRYNRISAATRIVTPFPEQLREDLSPSWPGFAERWQERLDRPDPFFNPHFDATTGDYRLAPGSPPHFPPRAARRAALQSHIDTPENFVLNSRFLRMHGWCFAPGVDLRGVRLVIPAMELFGLYGTSRPDVRAALPEAPGDHTGFELWAEMPPGRYPATLQFQDGEGAWHEAASLELQVPRWIRPAWFPGANAADLVAFQLRVCPVHAPRAVKPERFPALRTSTETRPRLAIVTPSFNQARFLAHTITSVLSEETALDYVVQDGGSTDGSVDIIRHHAEQCEAGAGIRLCPERTTARQGKGQRPGLVRLAAWESRPDRGQADAIARGFARTSGAPEDLMAWINSDDFYLPGALAFVADYFARHPEVDVLYGNRVLVDEKGREIRRWFLPPHDDDLLRLYDLVPQETLFWRRRIWDKVGGVDPSFEFALDWDLLLRFHAAGAKMVRVPYFLACFRVHPAQKTSAQMKITGQQEIDRLRERTFGRPVPFDEIENHPLLLSYLRRSAFNEFLWKLGIRV